MFNMSSTTLAPSKGHLIFPKIPIIGPMLDKSGNEWDIRAFGYSNGKGWCSACERHELHPYYTDTSGASFGLVSQTWDGYSFEVSP